MASVAGNSKEETPSKAFSFWGCSEIPESLGARADNERDLLERLESVDADSIYYHTVRSLLRRPVAQRYPNDFAIWVAEEVRDVALAERLALHSPFDFSDTEAFREHLLQTLDEHLLRLPFAPRTLTGRPFFFLKGHLTEVPLELAVRDLRGFRAALAQVDESAIYYHSVEAMGRLKKPRSDFAAWVDEVLGLKELARQMEQLDPFVLDLVGVKKAVLALIDGHHRSAGTP